MISNKILNGINGNPNIPGDKSISHRAIIIPSISKGTSEIVNILKSEDVLHTLDAFRKMGVMIQEDENKLIIHGKGLNSLKKPEGEIYLGNSGTSARLLTGLLASQKFDTIIKGDNSLSKRPMERIINPLMKMEAEIQSSNGKMPLKITGKNLKNKNLEITLPSAQIKSGLILASLNTHGETHIIENKITRNHTELMLDYFGASINVSKKLNKKIIKIQGQKELLSKNISVPSDLSSSAFFIIAALINDNSHILLKNININPTRNGILIALEKMGAKIILKNLREINKEKICDIEVFSSKLNGCELGNDMPELMIDEYPILAIAASFANSPSIFRGLKELRVKESDRLNLILINLLNCGVNCNAIDDDLYINPSKIYSIKDNIIRTDYDHRIAMAFSVMGTKIGPLKIEEFESVNTSFPSFIEEFNDVGGNIS